MTAEAWVGLIVGICASVLVVFGTVLSGVAYVSRKFGSLESAVKSLETEVARLGGNGLKACAEHKAHLEDHSKQLDSLWRRVERIEASPLE